MSSHRRLSDDVTDAVETAAASLGLSGAHILAAVSGGPDSLALLHALHRLRDRLTLRGLTAAHYDHGLRGEQSAAEAAFVADFCGIHAIPCIIETAAPGLIDRARGSTQEAARAARYAFLDRAADTTGADVIATAHHRDDQVETILVNILRGAGIDGLRGIPRRRGRLVRPLLDVPRSSIEAYCADYGLQPRRDPSNDDPGHYLRNRIRLELLPQLESEYHPGIRAALLRLSRAATADSAYLEQQARDAFDVVRAGNAIVIDALRALPEALQRRVIRLAVENVRDTRDGIEDRHVELALGLALGRRTAGFTVPSPDCRVARDGAFLTFESASESEQSPAPYATPQFLARIIHVPQIFPNRGDIEGINLDIRELNGLETTVELPGGWSVEVGFEAIRSFDRTLCAEFDADQIDVDTLAVRTRQDGDRIDPLGMAGKSKKLQDLFVDAKVARAERNVWPVIVDKNGPLWIPGLTQAERAKITDSTTRRLQLRAVPPLSRE